MVPHENISKAVNVSDKETSFALIFLLFVWICSPKYWKIFSMKGLNNIRGPGKQDNTLILY